MNSAPIQLNEWLVVVPARIGSTRLPRKPLADLAGKPLIARVYENLLPLRDLGAELVVATDDQEVLATCKDLGFRAQMTRADHPSGTDRCAEVALSSERKLILNVQGDEPFVVTDDLLRLMASFQHQSWAEIGTLVFPSRDFASFMRPNVVKAVLRNGSEAIYFSRSPIPHMTQEAFGNGFFYHHIGVYCFRRPALLSFCKLPVSRLELTEKLEQLRAIENSMRILAIEASRLTHGIDTPEDLEAARARYQDA
jgi:3-deoxy-manno-octulosonate cytidylyltransferase (CMP-KDO synthetase)